MTPQRETLIAALQGIAKFASADDPSAQIETMDTSAELHARWHGAYIKRDWFLEQFSDEQRAALADFDARYETLAAKYNKFPPILKFVASADGRDLCARAAALLKLLRA